MFKKSVIAMMLVVPVSAFAHGGHGGGHGGNHGGNHGGHSHSFGDHHGFNGGHLAGRIAARMNDSHSFTGFAKGSINMGNGTATRSVTVKDGTITKDVNIDTANVHYAAETTINKDGVMHEATMTKGTTTAVTSATYSDSMRSASYAVKQGDTVHYGVHSYVEGVGGLSVSGIKDSTDSVARIATYNDQANAGKVVHINNVNDVVRVGSLTVAPDHIVHNVVVKDGDTTHVHVQGYVGNAQQGFGFNKGVTTTASAGFEHSANSQGTVTTGFFGPNHYAEVVANTVVHKAAVVTDMATPASPISPASSTTPSNSNANSTSVYSDGHGDSVTFYWNV